MASTSMWVHGNAFSPELPANGLVDVDGNSWTAVTGLRQGWGVTFQGQAGHGNIFHVAIPTPSIVNGLRAKLSKVFVEYNCRDANEAPGAAGVGANITGIDVWDGATRIHQFGAYHLFGNFPNEFDLTAFAPAPDISFGVGLSVFVEFNSDNSRVTFFAAGADFDV